MADLIFFAGPNGSGKTRLLRTIADPIASVRSRLALELFPDLATLSVTYLPQGPRKPIFSGSVRSLLTLPLVYGGTPLKEAVDRAEELLRSFSFETLFDREFFTLSGGERQFVSLFSILLWDSDLALLDDPLAMLDRERSRVAMGVLNRYSREMGGKSLVISSSTPEVYDHLDCSSGIHLGFSPDKRACLMDFHNLLRNMKLTDSVKPAIELRGLVVAPFGRRLVSGAKGNFRSNQIHLLTGPNGEGKSCLLKVLAGLQHPEEGELRIVSDSGAEEPKAGVNALYLPQNSTGLLGFGSVAQELSFSGVASHWSNILDFFYLWNVLEPCQESDNGSYGERKFLGLLAIIGAAISNPSVRALLLDEPETSLDDLRSLLLVELLDWISFEERLIIVLASHRSALYLNKSGCPVRHVHLQGGLLNEQ